MRKRSNKEQLVLDNIITDIEEELINSQNKWGVDFDNKNTADDWAAFIVRYLGQAISLPLNTVDFRNKMIKVAALAIASLETLARNRRLPKSKTELRQNVTSVKNET